MLTIEQLDEFINYLKSGSFEKQFNYSGEMGKGELLELLERLMDAADVADEIATKLIFRSLPIPDRK